MTVPVGIGSRGRVAGRLGRGLKRVFFPLLATLGGLLLALVMLESALRIRPEIFSYRVQNLAFSKYDVLPDGVNVAVPSIRMHFMRRDFRTDFCFYGHCWEHVGDQWGFRNPPGLGQPELLLLGDSLIYGHGVEEVQTVAHFLRTGHEHPTYNMAKQGDCLYDHYVRFRMFAPELRPRVVLLFVFLNDFQDLESRRRPSERPGFPEIDEYDYTDIRARVAARVAVRPSWLARTLFRLHSVRLMVQAYRHLDEILARFEITRNAEAAEAPDPPFLAPILDRDRFRPLAEYYETIVPDLDRRCRELGARMVVVNVELFKPKRSMRYRAAQDVVREFLQPICSRHGIDLVDTGALFGEDWRDAYLARDGHLTEYGHRRLAGFLAQEALTEGPPALDE
jgi:hypothetical protein